MHSEKKNEIVTLQVTDLGRHGEGIGRTADGYTLFVPGTVPGDEVEALILKAGKTFGYGKLRKILKSSPDRVVPICPCADTCGGCQLQFMNYEAQLAWKQQKVRDDLTRIGGIQNPPLEPISGMQKKLRYRNKAQFPVGMDKEGKPVAGFYAGHSHRIVPCRDCLLGAEENAPVIRVILKWMQDLHIPAYDERTGKGLVRHVLIRKGTATGEILICLVINSTAPEKDDRDSGNIQRRGKKNKGERLRTEWKNELIRRLKDAGASFETDSFLTGLSINYNPENTNVILGKKTDCIWGRPYLFDRLISEKYAFSVTYQISSQSFYQVNHEQTQKIYEKVLDLAELAGTETVLDLYCGIGTISLYLACRAAHVIGVEIVPQAIEDARKNAELNDIHNAEFFTGRAEKVVPELVRQKNIRADVVVVDPPRKGCDPELLRTILQISPEKLIYVSCDPATLSRDIKYLTENGYRLTYAKPYDQFGMTVHVETVCLLSNRKPDSYMHLNLKMEDYYRFKDAEKEQGKK